jgi:hypothetical protein
MRTRFTFDRQYSIRDEVALRGLVSSTHPGGPWHLYRSRSQQEQYAWVIIYHSKRFTGAMRSSLSAEIPTRAIYSSRYLSLDRSTGAMRSSLSVSQDSEKGLVSSIHGGPWHLHSYEIPSTRATLSRRYLTFSQSHILMMTDHDISINPRINQSRFWWKQYAWLLIRQQSAPFTMEKDHDILHHLSHRSRHLQQPAIYARDCYPSRSSMTHSRIALSIK